MTCRLTRTWLRAVSLLLAAFGAWLLAGAQAQAAGANPNQEPGVTALVYHDVVQTPSADDEADTVSTKALTEQLSWMQAQGYRFMTQDEFLQARKGRAAYPAKPALLTFDDGYVSFYTQAYPVLRTLNIPATVALVGSWLAPVGNAMVQWDTRQAPREKFLSKQQLREMTASGLVDIASHSYDLHRGVLANPNGDLKPAAVTRVYDTKTEAFETEEAYRNRLRKDLERNARFLAEYTGRPVRMVVWPYGRYTAIGNDVAQETGAQVVLTLDSTSGLSGTSLVVGRKYVQRDLTLPQFARYVNDTRVPRAPTRPMYVRVEPILAQARNQSEKALGALVDAVRQGNPEAVFVNLAGAWACDPLDTQAAALLSRLTWQLATRTTAKVYADLGQSNPCLRDSSSTRQLAIQLATMAAIDGLVIRADAANRKSVPEVLQELLRSLPSVQVLAEGVDPVNGHRLTRVDACETQSLSAPSVTAFYEVHARDCTETPALQQLGQAGVRALGIVKVDLQPVTPRTAR